MAGAAHDPKFAKKMGIPQKVAKDFNKEDAGTPMLKRANSHKRGKSASKPSAKGKKATALRGALKGTY